MSNKFDDYDEDNDEISLTSNSTLSSKLELQEENKKLKTEIDLLNERIYEYEEVISKDNIRPVSFNSLSEEDIFNITHNSTYILGT